jgi:hypothetical protein
LALKGEPVVISLLGCNIAADSIIAEIIINDERRRERRRKISCSTF